MAPRINPQGVATPQLQTQSPGGYALDPYSRPPEDNGVARLSAALGDLAPALKGMSDAARGQETTLGQERARADFLAMKAAGKSIKDGTMTPAESPWFRRAYHETVGQLAASQYSSDLDMAMRDPHNPIAHSTDPNDFDKWSGEKRQEWLKANAGQPNADFMAGFNDAAVGGELNLRNRFVADAGARLVSNVDDAFYAKLTTMGADLHKKGSTPEQIAFWFRTLRNNIYFLNPKMGTQLSKTMTEAIFDMARSYEDPELLKIGDFIDSSIPGTQLSKIKEYFSKADDVDKEIRNNRQNRLAAEDKDAKRAREDVTDTIYDDLGKAYQGVADPMKVEVKPFLDRMATADPVQSAKLMRVIAAYQKGGTVLEEQELLRGLYSRAFDNDLTNDTIIDMMGAGKISIKTAEDLRSQLRLNKTGRGAKALIQDPYYSAGQNDMAKLFTLQDGLTESDRQTAASIQFRREWIAYRLGDGATAKPTEVNDWVQNAIERNFRRFSTGVAFSGQERLLDRHKSAPQPDAASSGPQPLKWEKQSVMDRSDLDQLAREHQAVLNGTRRTFSPVALELIRRFPDLSPGGVIDPKLVTKFIESQRLVRSFNPAIDDSKPDQLR